MEVPLANALEAGAQYLNDDAMRRQEAQALPPAPDEE